jgi:hypothetical protein
MSSEFLPYQEWVSIPKRSEISNELKSKKKTIEKAYGKLGSTKTTLC